MSTCASFEGLIAAAVYGDLAPQERARLEAHLAGCSPCRTHLEELRATARLLGQGAFRSTHAERRRVLRAVLGSGRRARGGSRPAWIPYAAAAASLAVAALLFLALRKPAPLPAKEPLTFVSPRSAPAVPPPAPAPERPPDTAAPPTSPAPMPEPPVLAPPPPLPPPSEKTTRQEPPPVLPTGEKVARQESLPAGRTVAMVGVLESGARRADVAAGQRLQAAEYAVLAYPDGTRLELFPGTDLTVGDDPAVKQLRLDRGTLRAVVAKQPADRPMRVRCGETEAVVLGTTFRLDAAADRTRLEVHEGRVRLARGGEAVDVAAGRAAVAVPGAPLAVRPLRATRGLRALYRPAPGPRLPDLSGEGPPLPLLVRNPGATAPANGGLAIRGHPRIRTEGPAAKILEACRASDEITLEAWIVPAGPAPAHGAVVAGLSRDVEDRNIALVQVGTRFEVSLRTSTTDPGGDAPLQSPERIVQPRLTHVVFTRSSDGREALYIDGRPRSSRVRPGTFANWNPGFFLVLADEPTEERPWAGTLRLVAVYARALGPAEVARNFAVGVDE